MSRERLTLVAVALVVMSTGSCNRGNTGNANVAPAPVVLPTAPPDAVPTLTRRLPGTVHPRRVLFDPTGEGRLLVMERDGDLQLWERAADSSYVRTRILPAAARSVCFSAGGEALFVGQLDGKVALWSRRGELLWRRDSEGQVVHAVAAFGDLLVSGSDAGGLHFWRHDGTLALRRELAHDGLVLAVAFSPDGTVLVSEGADTLLRGWRIGAKVEPLVSYREANRRYAKMLPNLVRWDVQWGWDRSIAFLPDGKTFIASDFEGGFSRWRIDGGLVRHWGEIHDGHHVRALAMAPDENWFASAGLDGTARLHELDGDAPAQVLRKHGRAVTAVDIEAGGHVVSASLDGVVRLWQRDGGVLGQLPRSRPPDARRGAVKRER